MVEAVRSPSRPKRPAIRVWAYTEHQGHEDGRLEPGQRARSKFSSVSDASSLRRLKTNSMSARGTWNRHVRRGIQRLQELQRLWKKCRMTETYQALSFGFSRPIPATLCMMASRLPAPHVSLQKSMKCIFAHTDPVRVRILRKLATPTTNGTSWAVELMLYTFWTEFHTIVSSTPIIDQMK